MIKNGKALPNNTLSNKLQKLEQDFANSKTPLSDETNEKIAKCYTWISKEYKEKHKNNLIFKGLDLSTQNPIEVVDKLLQDTFKIQNVIKHAKSILTKTDRLIVEPKYLHGKPNSKFYKTNE